MSETEFLTATEVRQLTPGAAGAVAQAQALTALGLPHRVVGRRVLISRHHLREWLAGRPVAPSRRPRLELAA